MDAWRRYLHRLSWLAWVAVFGLAVMPTLSHALAHAATAQGLRLEVCTPQGMKVLQLGADGQFQPDEAPAIQHLEHCPFCGLSAQAAPPPAEPAPLQVHAGGSERPLLFLRAPRPLFNWAPAQARAPPLRG